MISYQCKMNEKSNNPVNINGKEIQAIKQEYDSNKSHVKHHCNIYLSKKSSTQAKISG